MSTQNNLTTAEKRKLAVEKRKATIAARAAQEVEANIAFQNESRANGGREAKKLAKQNAVWNRDQSAGWTQEDSDSLQTRKRTSSTADATEAELPAKKARAFNEDTRDNGEDNVASKSSKKNKGKPSVGNLPPPSGADSGDKHAADASSKPVRRIDFSQVKSSARQGTVQSKGRSDRPKAVAAPSKPRAKIVADSASEDEAEDSDEDSDESDGAFSDEDGFTDVKEFIDEVPKVILSHDKADKALVTEEDPQHLFDSEDEEFDIVPVKMKARQSKPITVESDDSMSDAPPLRPVVYDSDNDDAEFFDVDVQPRSRKSSASSHMSAVSAVARMHVDSDIDSRGHHSRRSSMGSSYHGSSVPPSELESEGLVDVDVEEVPKKKKKKTKVSVARQRQAEAEQPVIRPEGATPAPPANGATPAPALTTAPAAAPVAHAPAAAPPIVAAAPNGTVPPGGWDASTIIVLPPPGRDIGLTAQPALLQQTLRGTIGIMKIEVLFVDAYPRDRKK
ncbi:hypothetical protein R3P38DRAFT_2892524 [Favolaschia claudopus]|uniref:Uncharacterized protein n=1 Tax=Favolaschia claudopus TaxID=2862362 RepID=A0AAW0CV45_9AGAR